MCLQRELSQLEERYKKAMMSNAQLDNEKQTYRFQVDLLKDQMDDMEEQLLEVQREHRDRCKVSTRPPLTAWPVWMTGDV